MDLFSEHILLPNTFGPCYFLNEVVESDAAASSSDTDGDGDLDCFDYSELKSNFSRDSNSKN